MVGKLLLYILSFFCTVAIGPAIFLLAVFVFRVNGEKLFSQHPFEVCLALALYMGFVVFMYFCLQDFFMVFRPKSGSLPVSRAELVNRLEKSFNSPVEGRKLFDFMTTGNRVVVTWSSSIDYFQITSAGATGKKRVVVLTLGEKKSEVFFIMKDKDWQWNLSKNFFEFSLNYSTGISAEFSSEYRPSIVFSENGGLKVDIKKLTYDSNDLWLPIQEAVLSSGWTLRGGMLPNMFYRILLAIISALAVFFMLYPLMKGSWQAKGVPSGNVAPSKTGGQVSLPDVANQIKNALPNVTTEYVQRELEEMMKRKRIGSREAYGNKYVETVFVVYANGYISRKDRNNEFVSKLRAYARENGISGLK
jgi:hypothetical protein